MKEYLKHQDSWTASQLKGKSYAEIQDLYFKAYRKVHAFIPIGTEEESRSTKRYGLTLEPESSKRQKISKEVPTAEEEEEEVVLSEEQLQQMVFVVPDEWMNVEAIQTKYPITDQEVQKDGRIKSWKIIRVGNHTEVYQFMEDMLKAFDRDDLVKLWSLVKDRFRSSAPPDNKERALWVELKRMFEPIADDSI